MEQMQADVYDHKAPELLTVDKRGEIFQIVWPFLSNTTPVFKFTSWF